MTLWWLSDGCLMTAWWLSDDCLMIVWWLSDDCVTYIHQTTCKLLKNYKIDSTTTKITARSRLSSSARILKTLTNTFVCFIVLKSHDLGRIVYVFNDINFGIAIQRCYLQYVCKEKEQLSIFALKCIVQNVLFPKLSWN